MLLLYLATFISSLEACHTTLRYKGTYDRIRFFQIFEFFGLNMVDINKRWSKKGYVTIWEASNQV